MYRYILDNFHLREGIKVKLIMKHQSLHKAKFTIWKIWYEFESSK